MKFTFDLREFVRQTDAACTTCMLLYATYSSNTSRATERGMQKGAGAGAGAVHRGMELTA